MGTRLWPNQSKGPKLQPNHLNVQAKTFWADVHLQALPTVWPMDSPYYKWSLFNLVMKMIWVLEKEVLKYSHTHKKKKKNYALEGKPYSNIEYENKIFKGA